ncbi:MAG: phycobilisome rod-core linker polypeptide [Cyanobacteria bacterium J06598_1]
MVSTFINPVVNPDQPLGLSPFTETAPVRHWPTQSTDEVEATLNAIYKQVLGNAYVMESERQQVPESQFKRRELNVVEFIRQIAKSDLYRTRFFENGSRNRFIELNFKHLLGRAPESLAEIATHSALLDRQGYDAEIDSYLDSDEYQNAFGADVVPYYRGYKTEGSTPAGFTHMLSLLRGASSSDKQVVQNNPARLTKALFADKASMISVPTGATTRKGAGQRLSVDDLLKSVFSPPAVETAIEPAAVSTPQPEPISSTLTGEAKSQAEQIEQLQKQLNELRSLSNIGGAILRKGQRPSAATSFDSASPTASTPAQQIEKLQGELMAARSLSAIAEFKLNKWRQRSY